MSRWWYFLLLENNLALCRILYICFVHKSSSSFTGFEVGVEARLCAVILNKYYEYGVHFYFLLVILHLILCESKLFKLSGSYDEQI